MSFNNPVPERPFTKTLEWKGGDGSYQYYDKDTKKRIPFKLGMFIPLEEMSSISGYCESQNKGIWSNEVWKIDKEELAVKIGNSVHVRGLYKDIKAEVNSIGGNYTKVVYALAEGEIVRLLFSGSGLNGWIDKGFSPTSQQCGVQFTGTIDGKKGAVTFKIPQFEPVRLDSDQFKEASEACTKLEAWLKTRANYVEAEDRQEDGDCEANQDEANAAFDEQHHEAVTAQDEVPF